MMIAEEYLTRSRLCPASEEWAARIIRRALCLAPCQDRAQSPRHVAIPQHSWRSPELAYAHRLDAD